MVALQPRPALTTFRPGSIGTGAESNVIAHLQQSQLFRDYQQAFETSLGLPLVLREAGSFRTPLQGSKRENTFCALMTQSNKTCASCLQLQQRLEAEATLQTQSLQCYAGLVETGVPIRVGNRLLGFLQTGQVFLKAPKESHFTAAMRAVGAVHFGPDLKDLKTAYFQTRLITRKQYEAVIRLLVIFAEHLASVSNQLLLTAATAEAPLITKARSYIAAHQSQELCLGEVARAVHLSAFYFCKYFKNATSLTFTEYLARARVESVKQLLLNPHLRVSEAAFAAGFQSLSQFNRVFRRITGDAPGEYRDRLHKPGHKAPRPAVIVRAA